LQKRTYRRPHRPGCQSPEVVRPSVG